MVKLINTPFGNYGYVLNQGPDEDWSSCETNKPFTRRHKETLSSTFNIPEIFSNQHQSRNFRGNPKTYEAKFLRTTDLAKGSSVVRLLDPQSYAKRGLLHQGQKPITPLEYQLSSLQRRETSSHERRLNSEHKQNDNFGQVKPTVEHISSNSIKARNEVAKIHAGRTTLSGQHRGFAKSYATSRSDLGYLASTLGSGDEFSPRSEEDMWEERKDKEYKRQTASRNRRLSALEKVVQLDPKKMPFSALGRIKSKRLQDVYSHMQEKSEANRRSLIMQRIKAAEKIKASMLKNEMEEQRTLLKSSSENQRVQLGELRSRYNKCYQTRLHSVYLCKPKTLNGDARLPPESVHVDPISIPLPREVYGLPEDEKSPRLGTAPSRPLFKVSPGRVSLDSYHRARQNLPLHFNNVWNKASRQSLPADGEIAQKT